MLWGCGWPQTALCTSQLRCDWACPVGSHCSLLWTSSPLCSPSPPGHWPQLGKEQFTHISLTYQRLHLQVLVLVSVVGFYYSLSLTQNWFSPFSIFLNNSWSTSLRFFERDSISGGILPPKKLESFAKPEDMTNHTLRIAVYGKQRAKRWI